MVVPQNPFVGKDRELTKENQTANQGFEGKLIIDQLFYICYNLFSLCFDIPGACF